MIITVSLFLDWKGVENGRQLLGQNLGSLHPLLLRKESEAIGLFRTPQRTVNGKDKTSLLKIV